MFACAATASSSIRLTEAKPIIARYTRGNP
jgi:hypothetical protein